MKASIVGRPALVGLTMLLATSLWAQDMVKVAPKNCQVLLDNDRVRVTGQDRPRQQPENACRGK